MASVFANLRTVVVACLVVSLSTMSLCPCAAGLDRGRMRSQRFQESHVCTCVLRTGHCRCGHTCHCGQQLPRKGNDTPAVPDTSNYRGQALGLVADAATTGHAAVVAFYAHFDVNVISTSNLTLVAQGTRLNV